MNRPVLKSICLVSPSLKIGGIERALVVLANHYAAKGLKIYFVSCLTGERFYQLDDSVELIEPAFNRSNGQLDKLIFYPRVLRFIRSTVKRIDPEAVLAFGDTFSPLVLMALNGTKYPVFISDRTSPDYKFKFPIPVMKRLFYPRSAGFIAQTRRASEYRKNQFGRKINIKVIPNAVREVKNYDVPREKIILYVGRFAWEKGPDRLIRAFADLEDRQDWKLLMAGSGPLLNPMNKLATQLNLTNEIEFLGKVEDVDLLYSKASIFVLPSVLEGFPNSLCEAMASGLPVVCYDTIPWEEILEPGVNGLVVDSLNSDGLSHTIQQLIDDEVLRQHLGKNAMSIRDRLSVDRVGSEVLEFIHNV